MQLHWYLPDSARNFASAGVGQISEKWPDAGMPEPKSGTALLTYLL